MENKTSDNINKLSRAIVEEFKVPYHKIGKKPKFSKCKIRKAENKFWEFWSKNLEHKTIQGGEIK